MFAVAALYAVTVGQVSDPPVLPRLKLGAGYTSRYRLDTRADMKASIEGARDFSILVKGDLVVQVEPSADGGKTASISVVLENIDSSSIGAVPFPTDGRPTKITQSGKVGEMGRYLEFKATKNPVSRLGFAMACPPYVTWTLQMPERAVKPGTPWSFPIGPFVDGGKPQGEMQASILGYMTVNGRRIAELSVSGEAPCHVDTSKAGGDDFVMMRIDATHRISGKMQVDAENWRIVKAELDITTTGKVKIDEVASESEMSSRTKCTIIEKE